jgi:ABC-2 type transport system permease protein
MSDMTDSPLTAPMESATRPMYWSVRRELWENRSIYLAPLAVAAIFMFGFMISTISLPHRMRTISKLDPAKQCEMVAKPYDVAATMLILTASLVGFFYCLDALHGERRDRSILFWKSLPVSDRTTVLSKASIPLVILPLLTLAIVITMQIIMLMMSTTVLMGQRSGVSTLWTNVNLFSSLPTLVYGLIVIAVWHAPIYAWLLLISAWAKRSAILWAVLPILGIAMVEKMAFNSMYFIQLVAYRLFGGFAQAFVFQSKGHLPSDPEMTPWRFLCTPGLWLGLIVAAALLAATIRLRRNREPI